MDPISARIRLAGHEARPAEVELVTRARWARAARALTLAAVWPIAALISFLIPPHGEPLMLVVFGGAYLIYREWTTHYVIRGLHASCPRCESALRIKRNHRLSSSLTIPCYGCHFTPVLEIGPEGPLSKR